jgi:PncC family amidohydrolase
VRHATLARYGVVSPEVALDMARGARRVLGADIGLGITGLAGPAGGTPEKPVGLICIGLSGAWGERVEGHVWKEGRRGNKRRAADAALALLHGYLEEVTHSQQAAGAAGR